MIIYVLPKCVSLFPKTRYSNNDAGGCRMSSRDQVIGFYLDLKSDGLPLEALEGN